MSTTLGARFVLALGACITSSLVHLLGYRTAGSFEAHDPTTERTAEAEADRIHGFPGSKHCCKHFEQFSGYLSPVETRHVFYLYVESQNDPANDPVVLWTNGGPGCSGLLGFGVEHGPYVVDSEGQVTTNPYSFNKVANMLYIEQPAGVGFSYADREVDLNTGDAQAAVDNYFVILEFLKRFPERQSNDFIISSESYGGHYMPQLALELLRRTDGLVNFRGIFVGNPYVDPFSNQLSMFDAFYGRGLIPLPDYESFGKACRDPSSYRSEECKTIYHKFSNDIGDGINPYALDYPICLEPDTEQFHVYEKTSRRHLKIKTEDAKAKSTTISSQSGVLMDFASGGAPPFLPSQDVYKPCGQVDWQHYLRRADVQAALHVHQNATSGGPVEWKACGGVHYYSKDPSVPTIPLFEELVTLGVAGNHSLNIMVLSGDDDSICSTASTQYWIWNLGINASDHYWKPWKVDGQTAGYLTRFDMTDASEASFSFATVHGAGHEVPSYRPMEALELFRMFLNKDW